MADAMTNDDIVALLDAEYQEALGSDSASQLRSDRQKALSYYEGDMTDVLPNPVDRSKAVSTDVADTIEGIMPSLMEVFCGGEDVVKFNPQGANDVAAANQETDYTNHIVMQKNPGFLVIHDFIKDAALSKVGTVKVFWEQRDEEVEETYRGLTQDELMLLAADDEIEIVEVTEYPLGQEPERAEGSI